jgi:hypothetical protein
MTHIMRGVTLLALLVCANVASAAMLTSDRGLDRMYRGRIWTNGSAGGTGWADGWSIGKASRGGTSIKYDQTFGLSFKMTAGSDSQGYQGSTQAFRQFSSPLDAGETFSWQMSAATYGDVVTLSQSQRAHGLGGGYITEFLLGPDIFAKEYYVYDYHHPNQRTGIPLGHRSIAT